MSHIRKLTNLLPQPVRFGLRQAVFYGRSFRCILCESPIRNYHGHGGGAAVLDSRQVVGGMLREANRCPVCHGADRTRLMMLYLETQAGVGTRPLRILHVAPDFGLYLWLKRQPMVDYVATDIDASRYRHIDGIQSADLTAAPFRDAGFDVIICSHVLEHIPDDSAAFAELFRLLRPGGAVLALTPFALDGKGTDEDTTINDSAEQDRRFGQWDHVRLYDRGDFLVRMRGAGFEVALFDPHTSDAARAVSLNLNPLEKLPIGRKAVISSA
jgi:SAM-dependent methyltransferase